MILYNLRCHKEHVFEAWFRDSALYDAQSEAGDLICPVCGSTKVEKALMAPRLAKGKAEPGKKALMESKEAGKVRKALTELRQQVEDNFDYVGPQFAEEARKIHYGEADGRNIYGETSDEDAGALEEEGVAFKRVPWIPRENS